MKTIFSKGRSALNFPNEVRSFDPVKHRILFWGYDSAIEISFFLEIEALRAICSLGDETEAGILAEFDAARERVHEIATKVWQRGSHDRYAFTLTVDDV